MCCCDFDCSVAAFCGFFEHPDEVIVGGVGPVQPDALILFSHEGFTVSLRGGHLLVVDV